ncbi:MAG: hypothetical protein GX149_04600 [Acholeplasmataceae bacterium]|jgi:predicted RNA-binding protein (virulence factor B family)|nr:hypothetical protein [Acholeplasmataceae bacterium]
MKIGEINKLRVLRKTDLGYMLEKNKQSVFLHNNETKHQTLITGTEVDAFLYYDFKNRLAATLYQPLVTVNKTALLKVVGVNKGLGVFVDIGINKDLLVSADDLPKSFSSWPQVDDKLFVRLEVKTRLLGKPLKPQELKESTTPIGTGEKLNGYIVEVNNFGANVFTDEARLVFVHHTQMRKRYRLGQRVEVNIIRVSEHTINGSFILQKEAMISLDAAMILKYLKANQKMSLTSDSSPEEIRAVFPMSKKAFKRALGNLYKNDEVKFENNFTIYTGDKDEEKIS